MHWELVACKLDIHKQIWWQVYPDLSSELLYVFFITNFLELRLVQKLLS